MQGRSLTNHTRNVDEIDGAHGPFSRKRLQVCSAVQNQDFTIVQDYITGLKALLYADGNRRAPRRLVKHTVDLTDDYDAVSSEAVTEPAGNYGPLFGPYLRARRVHQAARTASDLQGTVNESSTATMESGPDVNGCGRASSTSATVSTTAVAAAAVTSDATPVERAVGHGLKGVGAYKLLDRRAQVVALVNEVGYIGPRKIIRKNPPNVIVSIEVPHCRRQCTPFSGRKCTIAIVVSREYRRY